MIKSFKYYSSSIINKNNNFFIKLYLPSNQILNYLLFFSYENQRVKTQILFIGNHVRVL